MVLPNGMAVKLTLFKYSVSTEKLTIIWYGTNGISTSYLFKTDNFTMTYWKDVFSTE